MRILNVSPYMPPEGGGLERYALNVLTRLAERGHDVEALAFTKHPGPIRETRIGDVQITRVPAHATVSNTPLGLGIAREVSRRLVDSPVDAVIGHSPVPLAAEVAAFAARRAGIPYVHAYHAARTLGGGGALSALAAWAVRASLEPYAFDSAAALVTVSPAIATGRLAPWGSKVSVIPPGVDPRFLAAGDAAVEPDAPTFLFVGPLDRAYRWKGFHVLYEAALLARQECEDLRVLAIGEGDERDAWIRRARRDGVDDAVRFPGRANDDDLPRIMASSTALVLPSVTDAEAFGMVLLEANACGKPVIASRVGGVPGYVRDADNGLLVEPGDAADLARGLVGIARAPDLARRLGADGRARAIREHDWEGVATRWEEVLERVRGRDESRHARGVPIVRRS